MSQATGLTLGPVPLRDEERIYGKVTMRIVPFLFLCYLAAYLDRVNVAFAKLQMSHAIGLTLRRHSIPR